MPKLPTYSLHKATGQARVWLNGKSHYLGTFGSDESLAKYGELIKQRATGVPVNPISPTDQANDTGPTVNVVAAVFWSHAETYYVKNGKQTAELACIKSAMAPLCKLYGKIPAKDFGPLALKAVRQHMVDTPGKNGKKWCRDYINKSIERIRRIFRHAVANELIPASVVTGLESVQGLAAGRCDAVDYPEREPIPQAHLDAVLEEVNTRTKDMMNLCLLSACRPGEVCALTRAMIDETGDIWFAELKDHKMAHKGKQRVLAFGPKSQEILRRYFTRNRNAKLFGIVRHSFTCNIKKACERLKLPAFTAHFLRHTSATAIRKSHGLDATQITLGHSSASTTERYASPLSAEAEKVARDRG